MSAPPAGLRPVATLVLAFACLGLALHQARRPLPGVVVLHPLAPPLTRIAALGDAPIGPELSPPGLPPPGLPPPGAAPDAQAGAELRLAVEADAVALAEVLGPVRVGYALTHREDLSATFGETATWDRLVAALQAPADVRTLPQVEGTVAPQP